MDSTRYVTMTPAEHKAYLAGVAAGQADYLDGCDYRPDVTDENWSLGYGDGWAVAHEDEGRHAV